ncbi:Aldo/keto reductase [Hypoxylon rubiginosum]|uniref:Aldo/keto reductase n=1 Tax=Hypoxylon rubiginosum TaxID=110542 RepID=A0ACC0DAV9_9PEZI|nr:Aldo/keto reductase [Hypoxylon rubiginosum]
MILSNATRRMVIALGTDKLRGTSCTNVVKLGLATGYRTIDTAQAYGNEREVGKAIRELTIPRDEIFITTKISSGYLKNPRSFQEAYDSALASIHRLGVSYVDLFLIHAPGDNAGARRVTWQALERLVEEGMVKDIGVSNYGIKHIVEMEQYAKLFPPGVNQLELHPWCQQREIVQFCKSRGIMIQANCSLVRNTKSKHPGLCALATKYGKTTSQMLIRYSLQKDWTPIFKSGDAIHLRENIDVYDFSIGADDMKLMDSWDEGVNGAILESLIPKNGGDEDREKEAS